MKPLTDEDEKIVHDALLSIVDFMASHDTLHMQWVVVAPYGKVIVNISIKVKECGLNE